MQVFTGNDFGIIWIGGACKPVPPEMAIFFDRFMVQNARLPVCVPVAGGNAMGNYWRLGCDGDLMKKCVKCVGNNSLVIDCQYDPKASLRFNLMLFIRTVDPICPLREM